MGEPLKLNVVPTRRFRPEDVAADLRELADKIERDPEEAAGKFVLIALTDGECEGGHDGEYTFAIHRSHMRNSEVVALIEAAKHRLLAQMVGGG